MNGSSATSSVLQSYQLENGHLVNLDALAELTGNDTAFMQQLIQMFLDTAPSLLADAQASLASRDYKAVKQHVHKFKSSLNVLGNPQLPALAAEIEKLAEEKGDLARLEAKLSLLDTLSHNIMTHLEHELHALAAA